jgi:glycerol-3-phosphate dehydrogenase
MVRNKKALLTGLAGLTGFYGMVLYKHKTSPPTPPSALSKVKVYDALVVGGGVVGLSVAQNLSARGASVLVLEKDSALAAGASSGNSGLGCTGYDAPVGSLERALLRRSIRIHQNLYRSFGLSHDHVRKSGSLVVAWTPEQLAKLPSVLAENTEAGDVEATLLSKEQLREMEPSLSHSALGAVHCPREAVVEPWLVPLGYAASAMANGADIRTSTKVISAHFDDKACIWAVEAKETKECSSGRSEPGQLLVKHQPPSSKSSREPLVGDDIVRARTVINCAGLYGDDVEKINNNNNDNDNDGSSPDEAKFKITPRKGQFVVFQPKPGDAVPDIIIEPVASSFTKGVIAWTTVWGNIVVGPTAVDQTSKEDRSTDAKTIESLKAAGTKMIPALKNATVLGTYSGLRPASEHRDYQIYADPAKQWITVAGIRSTGLTASSGIGDYVGDIWEDLVGISDLFGKKKDAAIESGGAPDKLIGVTDAANSPLPFNRNVNKCHRVPRLTELAKDYQMRNDGTVMLHGRLHRVTHPITSFGMGSKDVSSKN